jgi:hypothetical protein
MTKLKELVGSACKSDVLDEALLLVSGKRLRRITV